MKKICAVLGLVLLSLTLAACGTAKPDAPAPTASRPAEEGPFLYLTLEEDRLYALPLSGGEPRLLADVAVNGFVRSGSGIYASFRDGSIRYLDAATGEERRIAEIPDPYTAALWPVEGGIAYGSFSLREGMQIKLWEEKTGQVRRLPLPTDSYDAFMADGRLFYFCYDGENRVVTCEFPSMRELRRQTLDSLWETYRREGETMLRVSDGRDWLRLSSDGTDWEPLELPMEPGDVELLYRWGDSLLLQTDYLSGSRTVYVRDGVRRDLGLGEDGCVMTLADAQNGKALLCRWDYRDEAPYYALRHWYLMDMDTGECRALELRGELSGLFADGDFPLMDSSTARKPVTEELYRFFCLETGAGGRAPLCSTTHNAWLNMADRKADIALLAAPTEEEQSYLRQRHTEVEMKLYGGDGLVFIGNRACGVENLSIEQLRGIFRGEITRWSELGGADAPIHVLYRDDQSGSQRLFEKLLWGEEPVPDLEALGFARLDEMSTIVWRCLDDPYAIGYSIMTYLTDVFAEEELLCYRLNGAAATPENVESGAYPLGTQGYVVIRADEPEGSPARRLFDWFGSPTADDILRRNNVTPLH